MKEIKTIICHLPKIHKKVSPLLPWEQMVKTNSQTELIHRAQNEKFNWLISTVGENNYYHNFTVLEATRSIPIKKILYAEKKYTPSLKNIVEGFNAFILNQWELTTLNGMLSSQAPLKKDGKILIYFENYYEQLMIFNEHQHKKIELKYPEIKINNYPAKELGSLLGENRFKIIIDTTTASYPWSLTPKSTSPLIKEFKNTNFTEIPILVCLKNQLTLKRDILKNIIYYSQSSKV